VTQRMNFMTRKNAGIDALVAAEAWIAKSFDPKLMTLVKVRVSQINGCAYCLHMHSSDARKGGETEARLYLLDAWEESALYTPRERAAFAWAEALTNIKEGHVPDSVYELARSQFSEKELADLSIAIAMINGWNRLAVSSRQAHPHDRAPAKA